MSDIETPSTPSSMKTSKMKMKNIEGDYLPSDLIGVSITMKTSMTIIKEWVRNLEKIDPMPESLKQLYATFKQVQDDQRAFETGGRTGLVDEKGVYKDITDVIDAFDTHKPSGGLVQ